MEKLKKYWEWQKKPAPAAAAGFIGGAATAQFKLLTLLLSVF